MTEVVVTMVGNQESKVITVGIQNLPMAQLTYLEMSSYYSECIRVVQNQFHIQ
jgi:hypothetical protein